MDTSWKDEYSVGIEEIDKQHMGLFDILNDLKNRSLNHADKDDIMIDAFDDLIEYGKAHFTFEETVMESGNFPKLISHVEIHNSFFGAVNEYKDRYSKGEILLTEVLMFLVKWLKDHILIEDHKYKKYFEETNYTYVRPSQ